ncbi:MAG: low molecular weight protein arginine phosphatase [Firmicutes bacterium]|nr:low molecular weight protein arginine phosphatase [Bacillota bacterium]
MNIVFVCTGNTCRSPLAEVIAVKVFEEKGIEADIISRGLSVAYPTSASVNSKKTAYEMGLSLDDFISHQLTYDDIEWADVVITMTSAHRAAVENVCYEKGTDILTLAEAAGENADVSDPFGGDLETYRKCACQIKEYIEKMADRLV